MPTLANRHIAIIGGSAGIGLALPSLAEHGTIMLVTAASAQSALPGTAALAAVNGAIEAAVPVLARELAPRRVNAVSPGVIETGWWDELPEDERRATFATYAKRAPIGRNAGRRTSRTRSPR